MNKNIKNKLLFSFICYLLIIIWIVFFKANIKNWILNSIEFMSKLTISERFKYGIIPFNHFEIWKIKSYFLNILIMILFPIYISLINEQIKIKTNLLIGLLFTILIEITQIFIPFCGFATEDIICNFIGVIFGILIYQYIIIRLDIKIINTVNNIFLFIFLPILIYAIINTIINLNIYLI